MYKTIYQLDVYTKGKENPTPISPDVSAIVLNQIKAGRDIDIHETNHGETINIIAPYHSIEYVIVESTRQQVEDPVDDNCIVDGDGGGEDTGTLTIVADAQIYNGDFVVIMASEALDGHYGPLDFSSDDQGDPFPDGYLSYAIAPTMAPGESITVPDLPVGMSVLCSNNGETATVPGTLHVDKTK